MGPEAVFLQPVSAIMETDLSPLLYELKALYGSAVLISATSMFARGAKTRDAWLRFVDRAAMNAVRVIDLRGAHPLHSQEADALLDALNRSRDGLTLGQASKPLFIVDTLPHLMREDWEAAPDLWSMRMPMLSLDDGDAP